MAGSAVLAAIDSERQEARELLKRLDAAEAAIKGKLSGETRSAAPPKPASAPKKRRGGKRPVTSPQAALERREVVHRFIHDQGGMVAPKTVREALGLSIDTFRTAASKLVEQGKMRKEGERQFTRYESVVEPEGDSGSAPPPASKPPLPLSRTAPGGGTLSGSILGKIQADGFVAHTDLLEFTDATEEDLRREVGLLIREEEIRMDRRDGKPGYIPVA